MLESVHANYFECILHICTGWGGESLVEEWREVEVGAQRHTGGLHPSFSTRILCRLTSCVDTIECDSSWLSYLSESSATCAWTEGHI